MNTTDKRKAISADEMQTLKEWAKLDCKYGKTNLEQYKTRLLHLEKTYRVDSTLK